MGYLSCNAESAISTCDRYNWDRRKKKGKARNKPNKSPEIRKFFYDELVASTNGFSAESFLGKGSHGSVYKAVLDDGKFIAAVKRTISPVIPTPHHHPAGCNCNNCTNCNNSPADNEIEILSRVRNPRLVNLIGFCLDSKDKKLLVVEYMPNGSLYELLHTASRPPGWTRRVLFVLQIAKAVHSLHSSNPPVIHRDIKSSNILIDEKGNARLGDFGLALRGHVEDVRIKSTPPAGTLGYLDPAYLAPGDLSTKSDVFSFGILLLEIISGRHAIDLNYSPPSVVDWAVPMIKHGEFDGICDRRIGPPSDRAVIRILAVLAARCVISASGKRPDMENVVECLKAVRKKAHSAPVWSNLQRRVRRVEKPDTSVRCDAASGRGEEVPVMRSTRCGSRRNRKVSSVTSLEYYGTGPSTGDRVIRSKSIGSLSHSKANMDSRGDGAAPVRRKHAGVTVKMPAVRLSKSRSLGVLQSPRLLHGNSDTNRGNVFGKEKRVNPREIDLSKLVITASNLDDKSERELLEKPLFST